MPIKWLTEKRNLSQLKPSEYNPRTATPKQEKELGDSLDRFQLADPIIINKNNRIIGGHFRYRILKSKNGHKPIDVRVPDRLLNDKEERELNIRLNKNSGEFDYSLLTKFSIDMLKGIGFSRQELDKVLSGVSGKDEILPKLNTKIPTTKTGDIFNLGRHTLLCGDSTNHIDVKNLLKGHPKYGCLTDPPYNIGFSYNSHNDNLPDREYKSFCQKWLSLIHPELLIFTPGPKNIWHYNQPTDVGWLLRLWRKNNSRSGASAFYFRICEPILFYGKINERLVKDIFEVNMSISAELTESQKLTLTDKEKHPPGKPVSLWQALMTYFNPDLPVVDMFGGNGTGIIAAEKMKRTCLMMENDRAYCDLIIKRWETYTGKKATKIV